MKRLRLFSLVVLGALLLGLLVPFSSLPVEGFPHLVTDSFDVDSIDDTMLWNETETSDGVVTAGSGLLNFSCPTASDLAIVWREIDAEDEMFEYISYFQIVSGDGRLRYRMHGADSKYIRVYFQAEPDFIDRSFWFLSAAGAVNYYNYTWTNTSIYKLEVRIDKTNQLHIRVSNSSGILFDVYNRSQGMMTSAEVMYTDIEGYTSTGETLMVYVYSVTSYLSMNVKPRVYNVGADNWDLEVDSFQHIRVDDDDDAGSDHYGYEMFYPDLQNLAFVWRGFADNYPEAEYTRRYWVMWFVYSDGTSDAFLVTSHCYRDSASAQSRIIWDTSEYASQTYDDADRQDLGISCHMEEDRSYNVKLYITDQNDDGFTDLGEINTAYDSMVHPDPAKQLLGVKVRHEIRNDVVNTDDMESKLEDYVVQYGGDYVVNEVVFPVATGGDDAPPIDLPWWVAPIAGLIYFIASVVYSTVSFLVKGFLSVVVPFMAAMGDLISGAMTLMFLRTLYLVWDFLDTIGLLLGISEFADVIMSMLSVPILLFANVDSFISIFVDGIGFIITFMDPMLEIVSFGIAWVPILLIGYVGFSLLQYANGDDEALYSMVRNFARIGQFVAGIFMWIVGLMVSFVQMIVNMIRG